MSTETEIITKVGLPPSRTNLGDYDQQRRHFSWDAPPVRPRGLPGGGLNIAYEALDAHLSDGDRTALIWLGKSGEQTTLSYRELTELSARFASALTTIAAGRGSRVFSLLGRRPELYYAALGTLRAGAVFTPLFSAFGPEPIRARMEIGRANLLLTTEKLYRKRVASWWRQLPHMQGVILVDVDSTDEPGCHALSALLARGDPLCPCSRTQPEEMALLHFTSGTTGQPKGVVHVHQAVQMHMLSAHFALDLRPGEIYWCTADPGWVTGTSYGLIAPLCLGVSLVVDEAEFDAQRWYRILEELKVNIWYTAPTAIRLLMRTGAPPPGCNLSALRFMASVGEPLNPEAVVWGQRHFGRPFHDNWWQTETGAIMIANYAGEAVKPGSMGRPLPGIDAAILRRRDDGTLEEVSQDGKVGELALKAGWPSMFRGYLNQESRYRRCFEQQWYLSGDLASRDRDGYYWFVGRADDLIKSSGHLIGPFEVESALMEHPAVAEAAVIGKPDPVAGEMVKAFVLLNPGIEGDETLRRTLLGHARVRLGAVVAPKEIAFCRQLPRTRSGKIMRRLLKNRELGLPEGDTSTLEREER
ncbi:acetate--CoA ligase [Ferrimonas sediminicola]|uniref:acetate--CoA ligase n=1 Tax=Ferrimonas sediminicola TaxID=2569538 RepID=A0A4U1BEM6_9GAMM|nr:acetate--CoA ligase [Ferrimonas sediminicola]TKB49308.1 acetate--CoA ligase [Ferrimonas sediminicola]